MPTDISPNVIVHARAYLKHDGEPRTTPQAQVEVQESAMASVHFLRDDVARVFNRGLVLWRKNNAAVDGRYLCVGKSRDLCSRCRYIPMLLLRSSRGADGGRLQRQ